MELTSLVPWACECGWAMVRTRSGPNRLMKCVNPECKHYGLIWHEPTFKAALHSPTLESIADDLKQEAGAPIILEQTPPAAAPAPENVTAVDYFAAAQLLRQNRKLRRAVWPAGEYIEVAEHRPHVTKHSQAESGEVRASWRPSHEDVNSNDWSTVDGTTK